MEFAEVLFLIMALFVGSAFLIFMFKFLPDLTKNKRTSQPKSQVDKVVNENIRGLQETYESQINALRKHCQSLQNTVNRLKGQRYKDDDDEDREDEIDLKDYMVDKEAARPFLQNLGLNAEALDSPILQQIIMDKLKGNTELALLLGILKPRNQTQPNNTSNQSNFDADFQKLASSGQLA